MRIQKKVPLSIKENSESETKGKEKQYQETFVFLLGQNLN